jgi:hypothetical protein
MLDEEQRQPKLYDLEELVKRRHLALAGSDAVDTKEVRKDKETR